MLMCHHLMKLLRYQLLVPLYLLLDQSREPFCLNKSGVFDWG